MDFFSPLRYPGGKGKLVPFFEQLITDNSINDGTYVEPYVGGGAVALSLLMREYVRNIIINDKDRSIYAFWYSVLYEADKLCQLIADTPVTMEVWHKQKEIQKNKENETLLSLGFSTFFLNRTNRSGIIKAGVIGGNDQTGNFKIDARYNKNKLIERIKRINSYADRIELHNDDAVELINNIPTKLQSNSLIYLDPPYYKKGNDLYMNYYDEEDHKEISEAIHKVKDLKWVITYDNSDFIKNLYKEYRSKEFQLYYSANNSGKGTEVMFFSDNCKTSKEAFERLSHIAKSKK